VLPFGVAVGVHGAPDGVVPEVAVGGVLPGFPAVGTWLESPGLEFPAVGDDPGFGCVGFEPGFDCVGLVDPVVADPELDDPVLAVS